MRRSTVWAGAALLVLAMWATSARAEGEEEGIKSSGSMVSTIFAGAGMIGYVIMLVSVAGGTLVIYDFMNVTQDKLVPEALIVELNNLFEEEHYEEALQLCSSSDSMLGKSIGAGLNAMGAGYGPMMSAINDAIGEQTVRYQHMVGWLNIVAAQAPMLGLFGTVHGMIVAFGIIKTVASPSPAVLAEGIEMALVTTWLGLVVAMPILVFYGVFRNRVERFSILTSNTCAELTNRFRPQEGGS
jgi:biopolymer transport protein ExbB